MVSLLADTIGVMVRVCAVCLQTISDDEQWFRVREEYVASFVLREIFETGFEEAAARKWGSGEAGAGCWKLITGVTRALSPFWRSLGRCVISCAAKKVLFLCIPQQ
jgi:hypothetical protein